MRSTSKRLQRKQEGNINCGEPIWEKVDIHLHTLLRLPLTLADFVLQHLRTCDEIYDKIEEINLSEGNTLTTQDFGLMRAWLMVAVQGGKSSPGTEQMNLGSTNHYKQMHIVCGS